LGSVLVRLVDGSVIGLGDWDSMAGRVFYEKGFDE